MEVKDGRKGKEAKELKGEECDARGTVNYTLRITNGCDVT